MWSFVQSLAETSKDFVAKVRRPLLRTYIAYCVQNRRHCVERAPCCHFPARFLVRVRAGHSSDGERGGEGEAPSSPRFPCYYACVIHARGPCVPPLPAAATCRSSKRRSKTLTVSSAKRTSSLRKVGCRGPISLNYTLSLRFAEVEPEREDALPWEFGQAGMAQYVDEVKAIVLKLSQVCAAAMDADFTACTPCIISFVSVVVQDDGT